MEHMKNKPKKHFVSWTVLLLTALCVDFTYKCSQQQKANLQHFS